LAAALVSVPRQQPNAAVPIRDDGETMAVVFHLVQPAVAGRRLVRRGGELEGDAPRRRCIAKISGAHVADRLYLGGR